MTSPQVPKTHTWWRLIISTIVCGCAVATWWYNTHPQSPVKQKIVQVKQGDGYVSEAQCRSIGRDKLKDVRKRFGVPAELNDDDYWKFPIRNDHERHCTVHFDYDDSMVEIGPESDVLSVDLELLPYEI